MDSFQDQQLIEIIQEGMPLVARPYAAIGQQIGLSESEVIHRIQQLKATGKIKRFGIVVRHRKLGYKANAMVVWDIPDEQVAEMGQRFSQFDFVTLCYRRPRHIPDWQYNRFCMIHGHDRATVLTKLQHMIDTCGLEDIPHHILFSRRCFKQRGANYRRRPQAVPHYPTQWVVGA